MLTRICLSLAVLAAAPAWSQATPNVEAPMLTPPPVSGQAYPTGVGSETRSNYLAAGFSLITAYNNNVLVGDSTTPVPDVTYSIWSSITLEQTTPRQHLTLTYSPGFTFYQQTSALDSANQNATLNFQYRLSQHTNISLSDYFQKSSNVFNQPYPLSLGPISGSAQSLPAEVVAPFADRLTNTANTVISYQFSRNGMIGAGGIITKLNYPNPADAPGIGDSDAHGGSAFYSQRLSSTQYIGVTYQYLRSQTNPVNAQANTVNEQTEVQTHAFSPFYTIYLTPTLSLSLSGGPQYSVAAQSLSPTVRSWTPTAMASIGWQGSHTNFVASYSRTVAGGGSLVGAFDSNNANAYARWQIAPTWTVGSAASYAIYTSVTPLFSSSSPGGHTVSGTVSVQHSLGEHFEAKLGYVRLHQSFSGIAEISNAPDSNSEFISVSYQFKRPLGR
jgi:hypothetical protein